MGFRTNGSALVDGPRRGDCQREARQQQNKGSHARNLTRQIAYSDATAYSVVICPEHTNLSARALRNNRPFHTFIIGQCMRQTIEDDMTAQPTPPLTFPDQPAANSGAAVGCLFGTAVGLVLVAAMPAIPSVAETATPLQAITAASLAGMMGGAFLGWLRDRR